MQLLDNIRKTVSEFRQLLTAQTDALKAQTDALKASTAATSALLDTTQKVHAASLATVSAVSYLARAERHRREQTGQVTNV
ncbi:MAG TPA: hypothetical protein VFO46_06045 [Candidatus Sulfotelmatobacter sp.]|nr:hypothetical protein [Candidatus Sulfotelmatobacter sp.]